MPKCTARAQRLTDLAVSAGVAVRTFALVVVRSLVTAEAIVTAGVVTPAVVQV